MTTLEKTAIIDDVDVFITDRPSTGMLEAMLRNKAVIAYNPVIQFWGDDQILENAIYFFRDFDLFLEFIKTASFEDLKMIKDDHDTYVNRFCGKKMVKERLINALSNVLNFNPDGRVYGI